MQTISKKSLKMFIHNLRQLREVMRKLELDEVVSAADNTLQIAEKFLIHLKTKRPTRKKS